MVCESMYIEEKNTMWVRDYGDGGAGKKNERKTEGQVVG